MTFVLTVRVLAVVMRGGAAGRHVLLQQAQVSLPGDIMVLLFLSYLIRM